MELRYKKSIYDPFEVFSPPKSLIKIAIKQLNEQCYDFINRKNILQRGGWPIPEWIEVDHKKVLSKIANLRYRLAKWNEVGKWANSANHNGINEDQIQQAKQVEIATLYDGALRRRGRTLTAVCPFHIEKTGSFTIYIDTNTYHCFGCGLSGDSIDYIISRNSLDFISAVKFLTNGN